MDAHGGGLSGGMDPDAYCAQFLDSTGLGTGTIEMKSAAIYKLVVPKGRVLLMTCMDLLIEDGPTGFQVENYGAVSTLASGCLLRIVNPDGDTIKDLTPSPVKAMADWAGYCGEFRTPSKGAGNEFATMSYEFDDSGERIEMHAGWGIEFEVQDDLSGLVAHRAMIHGEWRST